jgi:hypothetical protein
MTKIKPTLIIGLGSTGADVLCSLQELLMEEYQTDDFPVIRLLGFVTATQDVNKLSILPENTSVMHLQVPRMETVLGQMAHNLPTPTYAAMKKWFPNGAEGDSTAFLEGSNNLRPIGRLHFWCNFDDIKSRVQRAFNRCSNGHKEASELLKKREAQATQREDLPQIDQGVNIFLVGTLSGGTCSGMFCDFANYLRRDFGTDSNVSIFGAFTIPNKEQANSRDAQAWSSNTFTALRELDYLHKAPVSPDDVLPDGKRRSERPPFDALYLLAPATMYGAAVVESDGSVDHEAVTQMIATNLFLDVCAGTYAIKSDLRTNVARQGMTVGRAGAPRIYWSFGSAVFSYPRYQLGRAAAAQLAMKAFAAWQSPQYAEETVIADVNSAMKELQSKVLDALERKVDGTTLTERIRTEYGQRSSLLETDVDGFHAGIIADFEPIGDTGDGKSVSTIASRFSYDERSNRQGDFYVFVNDQHRRLQGSATQWVREFVKKQRSLRGSNILAVQNALEKLSAELERKKKTSGEAVKGEFNRRIIEEEISRLRSVAEDPILVALLLRDQAIRERKMHIIDLFSKQALAAARRLRAVFEVKLIEEAQAELKAAIARTSDARQKLRAVHDPATSGDTWTIANGPSLLHQEYVKIMRALGKPKKQMHYLYPGSGAEEQVKWLCEQHKSQDCDQLIQEKILKAKDVSPDSTFDELIAKMSPASLAAAATDALVLMTMTKFPPIAVTDLSLERWNESFDESIRYAAPWIELTSEYFVAENRLRPPGDVLQATVFAPAGNDKQVVDRVVPKISRILSQTKWQGRSLDLKSYMMIFYCEEPLFSTEFMDAFDSYKTAFEKDAKAGANRDRALWTDKRWAVSGGPDSSLPDRIKYIDFIMRNARDLFAEPGQKSVDFFQDPGSPTPYFVAKMLDVNVHVQWGDASSYKRAAQQGTASHVIPQLQERLIDCVRQQGEPWFKSRMDAIQEARKNAASSTAAAVDFEHIDDELVAFGAHTKSLAFNASALTEREQAILARLSWLQRAR